MAHRSIEEAFQAVKPRGTSGIPAASVIDVGLNSSGDLSSSLSQAGQQIAQLQTIFLSQAALIAANTQALQNNTSAQSSHSTMANVAGQASSFLGGGLGLLSPLISGIAGLFGGTAKPEPVPIYVPPAPVQIDANLRGALPGANRGIEEPSASSAGSGLPAIPHVTVNVSAMDSQSFMDRSSDIANAVREAMLNLHPINDVVANL